MSEPTTLRIVTLQQTRNAETIERLERMLKEAREGKITSIIYAYERSNGAFHHGSTEFNNMYEVIGFLHYQAHLFAQGLDAGAIDATVEGDDSA